MKSLLSILLLGVLSMSVAMQAQNFTASSSSALPDAPSQRPFWTIDNRVNVSILAGLVAADAITR
jgi:amino acid transporter